MNLFKVRDINSSLVPKTILHNFSLSNLRSSNNTMHNISVNCNFSFPNNKNNADNNEHRNSIPNVSSGGIVVTYQSNNPLSNNTNSSFSNGHLLIPQETKSSLTFKKLLNICNSSNESNKLSNVESTYVHVQKVAEQFQSTKTNKSRLIFDKGDCSISTIQPVDTSNFTKTTDMIFNTTKTNTKKNCLFSNTLKELDDDIAETNCKICHLSENSTSNPLICPCNCIGKIRFLHLECLKKWHATRIKTAKFGHLSIIYVPKYKCELCQFIVPETIKIKNGVFSLIDFIKPDSFHYVILEKINWDSPTNIEENTIFYVLDMKKSNQITIGNDPNCDVTLCKEQSKTGVIEFIECNFYFRDLSSNLQQNFVFIQGDIMLLPNVPFTMQNCDVTLTFLMKLRCIKKLLCYKNKQLSKLTYHDVFNFQKMYFQKKEAASIKNVEFAKMIINPYIIHKKRTADGSLERFDKFKNEITVLNHQKRITNDSIINTTTNKLKQNYYPSKTANYKEKNHQKIGKVKKKKNFSSSKNILRFDRGSSSESPNMKKSLFKKK